MADDDASGGRGPGAMGGGSPQLCGSGKPSKTGLTFRADIAPLFAATCSSELCHGGDYDKAASGLWLGRIKGTISEDELEFMYRSLVDIQSMALPSHALVRAEKPESSWLIMKLEGCFAADDERCALEDDPAGRCGSPMPPVGGLLDEEDRHKVESWIREGALF